MKVDYTRDTFTHIQVQSQSSQLFFIRGYTKVILYSSPSCFIWLHPFIPKSDQFRISPVASPEPLHHALCNQSITTSLIHSSLKGWENVFFELGSERVRVVSESWLHKTQIDLRTQHTMS